MQLFPYQVTGAEFLASRGKALLADEMGLGKSAQAIVAAAKLDSRCTLVLCPASLVENWWREIKRFDPQYEQHGWNVRSYDKAVREFRPEAIRDPYWAVDVLILDEAHYLKSHKAKRTKAIFGEKCDGDGGLVSRAKHVFCLTGTPTPNNPSELWPMLRAVMPAAISPRYFQGAGRPTSGRVKPLTYWGFVQKYCKTRDNGFGIQIVGAKNMPDLKEAIAPFVLRRKKETVLADLPPIRFDELALEGKVTLPAECTDEVRKVYEAFEKDGLDGLKAIGPHVAQYRRLCGLAKVAPAVEWIKEQFEGGLKKLVVFAHHRDVLDGLRRPFDGKEYWPAFVDGSYTSEARQGMVDKFQTKDDCKIFFGQIQAAGTGITLTAASDMLFVESSWVPAENEQAAMRIHRIGQRNACLVRFAMLAGSIDERIQRAVMRKSADIAKLFS